MSIKAILENTTPEQREKALQCKSVEELQQLAKSENMGLSDEEAAKLYSAINFRVGEISDDGMDNIAGGKGNTDAGGKGIQQRCPYCGTKYNAAPGDPQLYLTCSKCGRNWSVFDVQY